MAVSIGQNLFVNKLIKSIPQYTLAVSPSAVIAVGATGLTKLAPSPEILRELRLAYAVAIRDTLIFALAAACAAFPFACSMQWLNVKKVAEERLRDAQAGKDVQAVLEGSGCEKACARDSASLTA